MKRFDFTLAELFEAWQCRSKQAAFTLAEVLITLGIIGVVAAMTIPTLIQQHQEKTTVVKLKKFYSTFSQALLLAKPEYGDVREWSSNTDKIEASKDWINILKPHLKIVKECTSSDHADCFVLDHKKITGQNDNWYQVGNWGTTCSIVSFVLADGTAVRLAMYSNDCSYASVGICGNVYVDLNGDAKPNVVGKDSFGFSIYADNKVIPFGAPSGFNSIDDANATCFSPTESGEGCTAWVIQNNNMDYLHCPTELSWNGKHSCK